MNAHASPMRRKELGVIHGSMAGTLPGNSGHDNHARSGALKCASARVDSRDRLVDSQLDSRPGQASAREEECELVARGDAQLDEHFPQVISDGRAADEAAAAANPPRAWARPAERSSSAATSSSGRAWRGRGATRGDRDRPAGRWRRRAPGALAGVRPATRPSTPPTAPADGGTSLARRSSAAHRPPRPPAAATAIPSRSAARHTSVGSPVGSAAATSSRRCVLAGRASNRRRKLSSIRTESSGACSAVRTRGPAAPVSALVAAQAAPAGCPASPRRYGRGRARRAGP